MGDQLGISSRLTQAAIIAVLASPTAAVAQYERSLELFGDRYAWQFEQTGDDRCFVSEGEFKEAFLAGMASCGRTNDQNARSVVYVGFSWAVMDLTLDGVLTQQKTNICAGGAELQMRRLVPIRDVADERRVDDGQFTRVLIGRWSEAFGFTTENKNLFDTRGGGEAYAGWICHALANAER